MEGTLILIYEMYGGPKRNRIYFSQMTLVGADERGRFTLQGEASTQERLSNFTDKRRSSLRSVFSPKKQNEKTLDRIQFSEDGQRSNLRYLRFVYRGYKQQIQNAGFDICLTYKSTSDSLMAHALLSEQIPANDVKYTDYSPVC
ncbi:hypothetical protein IT408_03465 [Candidatus Uhrbacteria bacterium]|nr:hypothetical protein [Candidatus Uhrbacteria bacterium]